jgi:cell division protein FtsW
MSAAAETLPEHATASRPTGARGSTPGARGDRADRASGPVAPEVRATTWPAAVGPADPVLGAVLIALVVFGVVMVYSASAVLAYQRHDDGQHFLIRQTIYAVVALPLAFGLARLDYHRLRPWTYPFLFASAGMMLATTLGFGSSAGGAARWIAVGPIHIQPAEVTKLGLIGWLAYSLSKKSDRIRSFSIGFLPHVVVAGVLMLLCLRQPDFGSAVMMALLTFVMLFAAGARVGYMLGAGLLAAPVAWHLVAGSEYRMRRITAFLSPFEHRSNEGYQVAESLISLGAGGLGGVGIGDSRQKLFFLPEAHTDFIGAIIGEELGFVGLVALIIAYGVVIWRGMRAAYDAVDDYGVYLAMGATTFLGLQAFTNLAVAVGLLPTKGLVLPFVSYGGSALLVNCAAIGIVLNVSRPRADGAVARSRPPEAAASLPATEVATPAAPGASAHTPDEGGAS